jgi:hypothetical protein
MAWQSIMEAKLAGSVISCLLVVGCLAMIVAMLIPNATWSIRVVTGLVFAAYSAYVAHEWLFDFDGDIGIGSRRSEANPNNALAGFIVIGLPSLWYTIFGRFTLHKEEVIADESFEDFEDEEDEDIETK